MKQAPVMGHLRPHSSESGANANGPVAKPQTYSVKPKMATTELTPNSAETGSTAAEYTEEPHEASNVSNARMAQAINFLLNGQLFALAGSSSLTRSTRYSAGSPGKSSGTNRSLASLIWTEDRTRLRGAEAEGYWWRSNMLAEGGKV